MKQHVRRLAALLLAVVMVASMTPAFAFASEDDISDLYEDSLRQTDGFVAAFAEEEETETGEEALPAPEEEDADDAVPEPDEDMSEPEVDDDYEDEAGLPVAALAITGSVDINAANFPDAIFRNYVSANFDINSDDVLSVAELEVVTVINVYDRGILNLTGIKYFANLVELRCYYNQLTSLDLSGLSALELLDCGENQLARLDLKGLAKLEELRCYENLLTSLTNLPASLKYLDCYYNSLTSLPILPNSLETLYCNRNRLTSLPALPASLKYLDCGYNQLKSLYLGGCASLEELDCPGNRLTSLNLTGLTALRWLNCSDNLLTSLDMTVCPSLGGADCWGNLLKSLKVNGLSNLGYLDCSYNLLTSVNLAGCTSLCNLYCSNNLISALDLSGCTALSGLYCQTNLLTDLTVSGFDSLREIYCYENLLTVLDLSGCSGLVGLGCDSNALETLNLSGCGELDYLYCGGNLLTSLGLSDCVKLSQLDCSYNLLTGLDLRGLNSLSFLVCYTESESFTFIDRASNTLSIQTSAGGATWFERYSPSSGRVYLSNVPKAGSDFECWDGDVTTNIYDDNAWITMSGSKSVMAVFKPKRAEAMSLSPSRAVLTKAGDSATFTLALSPATANRVPIEWEVTANGAVTLSALMGTDELTITANSFITSAKPAELLVKAVYRGDDPFVATAKLQLLPGGIDYDKMQLTLLETKATVNTAKTEGALIPVFISERGALSTAALGEASAMASAGSEIEADILLLTKDKAGNLNPALGFSADWYEKDARYIEVKAVKGTKSLKDVIVRITPKGGGIPVRFLDANEKLNLTVTESYPKITVTASGSLNLFFPGEGVTLSASSPEGACAILSIGGVSAKDTANVYYNGSLEKVMLMAKAATGSYKLSVPVKVDGYDVSFATGKTPTVTVKVVNSAPKLKLGVKSVNLAENDNRDAVIGIFSADKGVSTADVAEKIAKIHFESATARGIGLEYFRGESVFYLWAGYGISGGKGYIMVTFVGGASTVKLPITINALPNAKLTLSSKTKAMTANIFHAGGASLDIPVTVNASNIHANDITIVSVGSGKSAKPYAAHELYGALSTSDIYRPDGVRLKVAEADLLYEWFVDGNAKLNDKKIDLNLGSSYMPGKTFKITLTVTAKTAGASVKVSNSGKLNVADPNASVTVTLSPKNTCAVISDITWPGGNDFYCGSADGNTFKVYLYSQRYLNIKMAAETVEPVIKLSDGQIVTTKIKLTPVFTAPKVKSNAKAVTLYAATPEVGSNVQISLTSPSFASLGMVVVDPANYAALGFEPGRGLEIKRSGEGVYTIVFEGCNPPQMKPDKYGNPVKLKSSYNLKLQVWAAGTYLAGSDGTPLHNGAANPKAMTKPVIVSVKVNVK